MSSQPAPLTSNAGKLEPIAIVGIGCRYPGGADSPQALWRLLCDGVDAITPIPPDRFDADNLYDPRPSAPGKIAAHFGGFLREPLDQFDAAFFGISPREAVAIDPQQRLLLEIAWEALEDAGLPRERLAGVRGGVYVGMWSNEYEDRMYADIRDIDLYVTTGGGRYSASGRLSYIFDLQGPSLTLDTACSSSLVAVHLACQSLRDGESTIALAGGVNLILQPHISIGYSRSRMLSPDGRCKFGDARANGYVRSEGAGMVVLKTLSQALADGDRIYSLVLGSAVNNDGHSSGLLVAPSGQGQEAMLREAYRQAGIVPGRVHYVEAHGTGTGVGDPTELGALGRVLSEGRPEDDRCVIGSIKTNIGHTEAASGVAGLIKAALCLQQRCIPPSLHFQTPNPNIPWDALRISIPTTVQPWPDDPGPAYAGVNSFGITGTNAHLVLQSPPQVEPRSAPAVEPYLLPISAETPEALAAAVEDWRSFLAAPDAPALADIAYSAAVRRTHLEQRLAVVAGTPADAVAQLAEHKPRTASTRLPGQPPRVAFVFPGQGGQWIGMGRELLADEPVFKQAIAGCAAALQPHVDWSLVEQLTAGPERSRLDEIDVVQPVLFAIQVALASLWKAWGVQPAAVVGHSMGEVAAAYVSGALSLDDAARIICTRSRLMKQVSGKGAMALVGLSRQDAQAAIRGYEDRLSVAVNNGPRSAVIAGDPLALSEVVAGLERREVFCRPVNVDVAAHSPHMDALRAPLVSALSDLQASTSAVPLYSTVTGQVQPGDALGPDYWGRNLREPVLFSDAVQRLLDDGFDTFVEINPHPILLPAIAQADPGDRDLRTVPSLRREAPERATLLEGLAELYMLSQPIDWPALYPTGRCVTLPAYPWQRERFWYESDGGTPPSGRERAGFLTGPLRAAATPDTAYWEDTVSLQALPFLTDHRVRGAAVMPAAAFVEMALTAARSNRQDGPLLLRNIEIREALLLNEPRVVQLMLRPAQPGLEGPAGSDSFKIYSRAMDGQEWSVHAAGHLEPGAGSVSPTAGLTDVQARLGNPQPAAEHVQAMLARGLEYGPAFQAIQRVWKAPGEALIELRQPDSGPSFRAQISPSLLDAGFQALIAVETEHEAATYLPVGIEALQFIGDARQPAWAHAIRTSDGADLVGDVTFFDADGSPLLEVRGLRLVRPTVAGRHELDGLFHDRVWQSASAPATGASLSGRWLIYDSTGGPGPFLAQAIIDRDGVAALGQPGDAFSADDAFHARLNPLVRDDWRQWLDRSGPVRDIVCLYRPTDDPARGAAELTVGLLGLVQALADVDWSTAPRLWLVTFGAQSVSLQDPVNPDLTAVWGLGGVIAHEHPALNCTRVDLSVDNDNAWVTTLVRELAQGSADGQIAWRGSERFVARLESVDLTGPALHRPGTVATRERPFRVSLAEPGVLDNLSLQPTPRVAPAPGQVEIAVEAAGLNFINVLSAMGIYPGMPNGVGPLGLECAGTVMAVGEGVQDLAPGDEVLAIAYDSLGSHAHADARLVVRKPKALSFTEAATLPIVFVTAWYGLRRLAQLQPGERVLIHSATGGVGLAAIQIAQMVGAEVFATAGSPEKRDYLHALGITHVYDSRTLAFADQVLADTGGPGVDVVLNSLTGAAIPAGLSALAPYGRFVEIGKRDVYDNAQLGLWPFQKNLAYFLVDLERMCRERPAFVGAMLNEVIERITSGELKALPVRVFPATEVSDAFRHMAQARHIGKIAITPRDGQGAWPAVAGAPAFDPEGTYLITGGLGALGLAVADWMIGQGARHLALMGRTEPTATVVATLDTLRSRGVDCRVLRGDVGRLDDVRSVLDVIAREMAPLKGVLHAAGVLDDGVLLQQTPERFEAVLRPKVAGAWHLHQLTTDLPLDYMVYFSSVASLMGTPGQGNYAAANAFLDGLAGHRRTRGLAALSIHWGPWSAIGLAARGDRSDRLSAQGIAPLEPAQGLAALGRVLGVDRPTLAVMPFDAAAWMSAHPEDSSFVAALVTEPSGPSGDPAATPTATSLREILAALPPGRERRDRLEAFVREQTALVVRLPLARIDVRKPLRTLGFDSLMTLELRNRLEAGLGLSLSATLVWNYPTISDIVPHLAEKLGFAQESAPDAPPPTPEDLNGAEPLKDLSADELGAMLAAELDEIDDLLRDL